MSKQPSSRYCFVCGRQNPVGLKMDWITDHNLQEIRGTITVPEHFNGYPGIVHGGIVAAILDETAGRAVLLDGSFDDLMVTLKLEVTYRLPTPTETPLTAIGIVKRHTGKRALAEGRLLLPDGTLTASCCALLMNPKEEIKKAWDRERAYWRVY